MCYDFSSGPRNLSSPHLSKALKTKDATIYSYWVQLCGKNKVQFPGFSASQLEIVTETFLKIHHLTMPFQ